VGVRILRLPANRGQGFALHAGIAACRAPVIATMDGDGQNVPDDLLRMLPLLSGADMIVGVRADRRDSVLRRLVSRAANAIRGRLLRDARSDAGCAVKVFRREVAAAFFPLKMLNPFMPALASAAGHTLAEIPVRHRARTAGRSKYGLGALSVRPVADFITVWRRIHYS
jgi:glycosyltransferase involved in cell wall biosynthesis